MAGAVLAHARDYSFLTFETSDGAKASVSVENLTLSVSGTMLMTGSQSFNLSNLNSMYFTTSDESTSGIERINIDAIDDATDIFDLKGNKVPKEQMHNGVYIVKTKQQTYKIVVK